MDITVLKFIILLSDNLNGLIKQISDIAVTSEQIISAYLAILLPGIFYVVSGVIYTSLLNHYYVRVDNKNGSHYEKIVNVIVSWSVFFGGVLYFVGDNIVETTEQFLGENFNATETNNINTLNIVNSIQPILLILALILHDILPYEFKQAQLKDHGKKSNTNDKENKEDIDYSLYKEMVNIAVLIIKFDSWYTIIQSAGICTSQIQLGLIWFLWFLLSFGVYSILVAISIYLYFKSHRQKKHNNYQSNILYGFIMSVVFLIAFAFSLLGDNNQPLDCYQQESSIVRLCFILVSFVSFLSSFVIYVVYLSLTGQR